MRLIDADKLKDIKRLYHFREQYDENLFDHIINQLPTIDAVEVVRCKDCKYHTAYDECTNPHWDIDQDLYPKVIEYGFCSYGERRQQ